MTTEMDWRAQVGRSWAQNYALTDRSFAGLTELLLGRAAPLIGKNVLDIGCGAGELSLALARQHPDAQVLGVDISQDLIEVAKGRGADLANASFVEADAGTWRNPEFAADLIVSRHGVMFFADPVAAFANLRAQGTEQVKLLFSCFRTPAENAWAAGLAQTLDLPPPANPRGPGPFAFADPGHVEAILSGAGWHEIELEPADFAYVAGMGEDPVEDALGLFRWIGPAAPYLRSLDGEALETAEVKVRAWLEQYRSDNLVAMPAAAWLVSASADRRHRIR
ncbi:MAG: class I SAM-dependent methyltransferase [Novosphingobium sp.]|jgi:SAM-dependent methyltransferase|nr:methyltransferase domain-containing protein [Brevundimonas sp.]